MQLLWGYVNTLQLISLIPLMNLVVPSNIYYACSLISGPLSLQIYDMTDITTAIFSLDPNAPPYNPLFGNFGFQNVYLLVQLELSLYFILAAPFIFLFIYVYLKCTNNCRR